MLRIYSSILFTTVVLATVATAHRSVRDAYRDRDDRDPLLLNLFEVILSTIDAKLRRIENMDRAIEHLMRRVEGLDSRLANNNIKSDSILAKLRGIEGKLSRMGQEGPENLDGRMKSLDEKVNTIDDKINTLKHKLDNTLSPLNSPPDELNIAASERRNVQVDVPKINLPSEEKSEHDLDLIQDIMTTINRKLEYHMNEMTENVGTLLITVQDIHEAIIEDDRRDNNTSIPKQRNRIDTLVSHVNPLQSVSNKMEEVWSVVVGTKSSVDNLVPKSEELLTKTQRQERAINSIHSDLNQKTDQIIENLNMVERKLLEKDAKSSRALPLRTLGQNDYYVLDESDPTLEATPDTQGVYIKEYLGEPEEKDKVVDALNAGYTPKSHGVIFPSVKNKPVFGNNSMGYDPNGTSGRIKGYNCADLQAQGMLDSGVYYLQIRGTTYWYLKVYCEMGPNGGGWIVIQRRQDFGHPRENFNRDWEDYKHGFGDPSKELWLGNENIFMLTNSEDYVLRVELEDFDGNNRWAEYSTFRLYSEEDNYKLEIGGYEGNAGDSLNDPWYGSNLSPFSTFDRDNDRSSLNCASMLKGGWWWRSCGRGLNGLYLTDPQDLTARQGIVWFRWRGWDYTLRKASMMIRPKAFAESLKKEQGAKEAIPS